MRSIGIHQLESINADVASIEVFPESWSTRRSFSLYENQPRPCSALFFLCTDTAAVFCPQHGRQVEAHRGDVVYIPKGIQYHVYLEVREDSEAAAADTYTVNFCLLDENREELSLSPEIAILTSRRDALFEVHARKLCEVAHRAQKSFLKTKAEFFQLLDAVISSASERYNAYYPIRIGAEALRSQWNQNTRIEVYADMCGVSSAYFYQCFRQWAGKSPVEYRNTLRLSNAETMLRLTDMRISEISEIIGFRDSFYFCRLFTRQFGISPQKYRKEFRSEPDR